MLLRASVNVFLALPFLPDIGLDARRHAAGIDTGLSRTVFAAHLLHFARIDVRRSFYHAHNHGRLPVLPIAAIFAKNIPEQESAKFAVGRFFCARQRIETSQKRGILNLGRDPASHDRPERNGAYWFQEYTCLARLVMNAEQVHSLSMKVLTFSQSSGRVDEDRSTDRVVCAPVITLSETRRAAVAGSSTKGRHHRSNERQPAAAGISRFGHALCILKAHQVAIRLFVVG